MEEEFYNINNRLSAMSLQQNSSHGGSSLIGSSKSNFSKCRIISQHSSNNNQNSKISQQQKHVPQTDFYFINNTNSNQWYKLSETKSVVIKHGLGISNTSGSQKITHTVYPNIDKNVVPQQQKLFGSDIPFHQCSAVKFLNNQLVGEYCNCFKQQGMDQQCDIKKCHNQCFQKKTKDFLQKQRKKTEDQMQKQRIKAQQLMQIQRFKAQQLLQNQKIKAQQLMQKQRIRAQQQLQKQETMIQVEQQNKQKKKQRKNKKLLTVISQNKCDCHKQNCRNRYCGCVLKNIKCSEKCGCNQNCVNRKIPYKSINKKAIQSIIADQIMQQSQFSSQIQFDKPSFDQYTKDQQKD